MNNRGTVDSEAGFNCNFPLKRVLKKIFRRRSKTGCEDSIVHICGRSDSFVYKSTKSNDIVTSQKNGQTTSNNNFQIPQASTFDVKFKLEYSKRDVEPSENKIVDSGGHQTTSKSNFSTNLKNTDHAEERKINTFQDSSFAQPVETQCENFEDFDVKKLVALFENGILSNGNKKKVKTKKSVTFKDVDDTDISLSKLPASLEIDNGKEMQTCSKIEGKDLENTVDIENLEHLKRNHSTTNSQKENDYSHEYFHEPKVSALDNSKSSPQPKNRVADLVKIFEKPAEKLSNVKRPTLCTDLCQDACGQPSEDSRILLGEKKINKFYKSSSISKESANKRIGNNSSQVSRSELPPAVPAVLDIAPNPPNDVQVPSVVHQLVTTKYEETMNHIKHRKINRKQRNVHMDSCEDVSFHIKSENSILDNLSDSRNDFSSDLDGHRCDGKLMYAKERVGKIHFYGTSTDSGLNQSSEVLKSKRNPFGLLDCQGSIESTQKFNQRKKINIRTSSDSGFDKSDDTLDSKRNSFDVLHCSETTESVAEYDSQEFLRVALGEELMNLTLSSTKSSQFDQTQYTGEQSNYEISQPYSNRSFVENSISSQSLPIATIPKQIDSNSDHVVTEERNNDTQHKETEKLMKQIDIQKERLNQLSKALLICRSQPKYVDQDIRIEAEKITLVETCIKERMEEEVKRSLTENKNNSNAAIAVTIKNLNFSRATFRTNKRSKKYSWFFVCILETGTTVFASKLVKSEANEILFPESFQFEGLPSDLVITIKLFAMSLRNRKMKKKGLEMKIAPEPSPNYFPAHSFFSLWGKTEINPVTISKEERHCFKLTDMPRWSLLSNTFGAELETVLKIPVMKKGFLTIGVEEHNRLPLWNNRWCVLDGCKLKYWNHPFEEQVTEPLGELNLLNANCHRLQEVKNDLCPWPKRSFALDMKVEGYRQPVRKYFLVSDNVKEFEEWWNQINLVLEYLQK